MWDKVGQMLGNFIFTLDNKGRLTIPSKMRQQLVGDLYLSLGFEKTIELRTSNQFNDWKNVLLTKSSTNAHARQMQRAILGNTYLIKMDDKGRINIPIHLMKNTPIKDNVVVVGMFERIEIWDSKAWDDFMSKVGTGLLEEAAETLDKE